MDEESSDSDDEQQTVPQLASADKRQFGSTAPPLPPLPPVPDKVIVKKYDPKLGKFYDIFQDWRKREREREREFKSNVCVVFL